MAIMAMDTCPHLTPVLLVGRGDNLQLFISPLLKYEGWLYNIIDDKSFEINSLEPPVQGVWKFHIPLSGPVEMQKT